MLNSYLCEGRETETLSQLKIRQAEGQIIWLTDVLTRQSRPVRSRHSSPGTIQSLPRQIQSDPGTPGSNEADSSKFGVFR